jgi:hypothetical protein
MFNLEYEPTHKKNVFNPDMRSNENIFLTKLKKRISYLNKDTTLEIKNLLKSST